MDFVSIWSEHGCDLGKAMKLVIAVIKPYKLDEVTDALTTLGVHGMTVVEVKGFGRQKGRGESRPGDEYMVNFVPKTKVEIACGDGDVGRVVATIEAAAKTGTVGDGKIFVLDLEAALRIRTGETGAAAL